MSKSLIDAFADYDHPEHFDDIIREYRTSERYVPSKIEDMLCELSGHKCTICGAPWIELHHILPLEKGGKTEYENLIVLCPNCHTRVHKENIPNQTQLRHYKLKQEIAYELPVINKLSQNELNFLVEILYKSEEEQAIFSKNFYFIIQTPDHELATQQARKELCFLYLEISGVILSSVSHAIKKLMLC